MAHTTQEEKNGRLKTGLSLEDAVRVITEKAAPLGLESGAPENLLGRTLARNATACLDQPPFNRSPLDGYALRSADTDGASRERPARLFVVDTVYAGNVARVPVGLGQAVRIMTGAMLPPGCDCVVRQEDTDMGVPEVRIFTTLRPHDNFVDRGEDFRAGACLLPAGSRLDAAAVGVLSSAGITEIPVKRRPRVRLLSTGDEVVAPSVRPLPPGKIYGANLPLLLARLRELGFSDVSGELVGDEPQMVADTMRRLLADCDVLLTTGGVSVGEKDIFHEAIPLLGAEQIFWKIKLKPGSPAMFSTYNGKPILSLSGNPFAAFTTFELLVRPLLAAMSGESWLLPRREKAVLSTPFSKASKSRRFIRGRHENGYVSLPEGHSSGMLASLVGCNCLVDIPAGSGPLKAGELVDVLLL